MHKERPDLYKDPNPKPEIAIALSDNFIACAGFADHSTLRRNFSENEILHKLLPVLTLGEFYDPEPENPRFLKALLTAMLEKMDFAKEFLEDHVRRLEIDIQKILDYDRTNH